MSSFRKPVIWEVELKLKEIILFFKKWNFGKYNSSLWTVPNPKKLRAMHLHSYNPFLFQNFKTKFERKKMEQRNTNENIWRVRLDQYDCGHS